MPSLGKIKRPRWLSSKAGGLAGEGDRQSVKSDHVWPYGPCSRTLTFTEEEGKPLESLERRRKWSDVHFNKISLAVGLRVNQRVKS